MIEIDQVSHGLVQGEDEVAHFQWLHRVGRFLEAANLISSYAETILWERLVDQTSFVDGIGIPHRNWNNLVAISLQGYGFEFVAKQISRMFNIDSFIIGLKDDSRPTVVDFHFNGSNITVFLHAKINQGWAGFVASRFIGILPMIAHVYRYRRGNGFFSMSMLDDAESGDLAFSSNYEGAVLLPDPIFIESAGYQTLRRKFENPSVLRSRNLLAMWRGSTTGIRDGVSWKTLPRASLCHLASQHPKLFDCGITHVFQVASFETEEIETSGLMRPMISSTDFNEYAFHIDIDGNSNSWPGFFSKLLTGGAVFKVASPGSFCQWFYHRLKPWMHYIPVRSDLSDLVVKVEWARDNLERAEMIGRAGHRLAMSMTLQNEMAYAVAAVETAFA